MKKIYSFLFASLLAVSANAQLTTHSNYDVNADGNVTVSDATETVDYYVSGRSDNRHVVDAATLNSVLKSIDNKLEKMSDRLTAVATNVGSMHNGHAYVDLGTGVKWATCNVGASSPEDYGDYFAWGETTGYKSGKTTFDWSTYKWCNGSNSKITKYSTSTRYWDSSLTSPDNKTILDPEDDAAHVNWGGNWRMPTEEELIKLMNECYWQWVTSYNGKSVNGYIVYKVKADADKRKTTNDSSHPSLVGSYSVSDPHIFLPAAGRGTGSLCQYWTSSLEIEFNQSMSYSLNGNSTERYRNFGSRSNGLSVRAVCQ